MIKIDRIDDKTLIESNRKVKKHHQMENNLLCYLLNHAYKLSRVTKSEPNWSMNFNIFENDENSK